MTSFRLFVALLALSACKSPTPPADDADGDGFTEPADCDDANPLIRPGALDVWNDGIDANCDEEDRFTNDFLDFPLSLRWGDTGSALPGSTQICDLNGDGQDDLLVAENRGTESRVFGFFGPLAQGTLSVVQADMILDLGFPIYGAVCTDFDGDGRGDVVVAETREPLGLTPAGVWLFYQPATGFTTATDADAVELNYNQNLAILPIDLTGNGRLDLMLLGSDGTRRVVEAGSYTAGHLLDEAVDVDLPDFSALSSLNDIDGDGTGELLHCDDDVCNIYAAITPGSPATLISAVDLPGSADVAGTAASGDFDGDGSADDLIITSLALGVGLVLDAGAAVSAGTEVPQPTFIATHRGTNFVLNAGDVDGDGADDVMFWVDGTDGDDRRLFSGGAMATGERKAAATLLRVERANASAGGMASGDLDADGNRDVVFVGAGGNEGFLGIYLSSEVL